MKRKLLLDILEITKQQAQAIGLEDVERFDELTRQKQVKIQEIDQLHESEPHYREDKQNELLEEIIELDSLNKKAYEAHMYHIKSKLNKMRASQRVNQVYTDRYSILASEEGIFFDKGRAR